jgi:hypothetical protein
MLNIQLPHDFYYFGFGLVMLLFMVVLIPREGIKKLFGLSFVWGYLGSIVFVMVFSGLLNLFKWQETAFSFMGSPFILNLAWAPAILIYLYFLPKTKHLFWLYLVTFSLVSAGIDVIFYQLETLQYISWGPLARFIVAIVWFLGATLHFNYLTEEN